MSEGAVVGIVFGGLFLIALTIFLVLLPCNVFFGALFSGCYVSAFKLISMKLRKVNVSQIVSAYIMARKTHLGVTLFDLELISSSGGRPVRVVEGLNAANSAKLKFDLDFAKAVDISGRDLLEVVRECISPKTIELPLVTAVAQDNFEVNVKISLTLKVNLKNFLRGATEETISARAVEAVVTKIANTVRSSDIVSKPQLLDKAIFDAGVDEDCKYELLSADVILIDLGANRGLAIEKEQIERERILTSNQLEERRLTAVAVEQEMKAKEAEMKAREAENETEVPLALKQAIEEGKMKDVVDFYLMQNLQADTDMRRHMSNKQSVQQVGNDF